MEVQLLLPEMILDMTFWSVSYKLTSALYFSLRHPGKLADAQVQGSKATLNAVQRCTRRWLWRGDYRNFNYLFCCCCFLKLYPICVLCQYHWPHLHPQLLEKKKLHQRTMSPATSPNITTAKTREGKEIGISFSWQRTKQRAWDRLVYFICKRRIFFDTVSPPNMLFIWRS